MQKIKPGISLIASDKNWVEGEAVRQLEFTASLLGMKKVVGLPDLHPGKGFPIGCAFFSKNYIHPYLIGNDIGCGMSLFQTNIKKHKLKIDQWTKKIPNLEEPYDGNVSDYLKSIDIDQNEWQSALGTLGGGNHFVELQMINTIENQTLFQNSYATLNKGQLFLLVHSGSRGLGTEILRKYVDKYRDNPVKDNSDDFHQYLMEHNNAVQWASLNRHILSQRFIKSIGGKVYLVADLPHNMVSDASVDGVDGWLHRKGAISSNSNLLIIPGSRGTLTYLVAPIGDQNRNCFSLAHGAGRKWKRSDSRGRLHKKYSPSSLLKTSLGSRVICSNKDLLYEEAPQNYKNISIVIDDLVSEGLIEVVATLKPVLTYKTRKM